MQRTDAPHAGAWIEALDKLKASDPDCVLVPKCVHLSETTQDLMAKILTLSKPKETIKGVIAQYVAGLPAKRVGTETEILRLFESSMNNYAYQSLAKKELGFFDDQFNNHGRQFCELFGPEKVPENVGEFLNYFMVRKVIGSKKLVTQAPLVVNRFLKWLQEKKMVSSGALAHAAERATAAAKDQPIAEKLGEMLHNHAARHPLSLGFLIKDDDILESTFLIKRVEENVLYLVDWEDPDEREYSVPLSDALIRQAKKAIGFTAWLQMGLLHHKGGMVWKILEVGTVEPL